MRPYQISVCGDSAINIVVADTISAEASALVRSAPRCIQAAGIAGIEDIVPTFCAVMVAYNPETISYEELVSARARQPRRPFRRRGLGRQDHRDSRVLRRRIRPPTWNMSRNSTASPPMKWCACTPSPRTSSRCWAFCPGFAYLSG